MPERDVIGSMTRSVNDLELRIACSDQLAIRQHLPSDGVPAVTLGPGEFRKRRTRPSIGERTHASNVIAVGMADEHASGTGGGCPPDRVEVCGDANSRIDQHWMTSRKKVGPVASACQRTWIGGVDSDDQKNTFSRP